MDEETVLRLAAAMVEARVDVCGMGMFGSEGAAREVIDVINKYGFELKIEKCPTP